MENEYSLAPAPARSRAGDALLSSARHLACALRSPVVVAWLAVYVVGKVGLNLYLGARLSRALPSALVGPMYMGLLALVMDAIAWRRAGAWRDESVRGTAWETRRPAAMALLLLVWGAWLAMIVDGLQRAGQAPGSPILDGVLGWPGLVGWFANVGDRLAGAVGLWPGATWDAVLRNVTLRAIMPGLVLLLAGGLRWRDLGLSARGWQVALPVVLLFGAAYAAQAPVRREWATLLAVLLHPGLTEELLYRAWMQRALRGWLGATGAILVAASLFALLHAPSYYYALFGENLAWTVANLLDVALTGAFWGYGFVRSGGVLPWACVHALSDLVGL